MRPGAYSPPMELIGFIGLGNMGRGMASNLCRKLPAADARGGEGGSDTHLVAYDINPAALDTLSKLGARAAASVADLAKQADVVFTMLPDSAAVDAVIAGPDGLLAHLKQGAVVVDMSTVDPHLTDRLGKAAAAKSVGFADAPVGRLASHADRGESLFMVGADDITFARIKPFLDMMGTTIHHCGGIGAGMRTKLVNNFLAIVSCQMNAEAIALAQRFGLSLEKTLDVIHGTTATNGQLKLAWATKVLKGDTEPGFTIDLAHKDLSLILDAANSERVPVSVAAA